MANYRVTAAAQMLTVRVPLAVRKQRGGRKLMIAPASTTNRGSSAADTTLVKALACAFRWRRMMEAGRYGTIDELAAAEKISPSYVPRRLRLTLLSPDIEEVIMETHQTTSWSYPIPFYQSSASSNRCVDFEPTIFKFEKKRLPRGQRIGIIHQSYFTIQSCSHFDATPGKTTEIADNIKYRAEAMILLTISSEHYHE